MIDVTFQFSPICKRISILVSVLQALPRCRSRANVANRIRTPMNPLTQHPATGNIDTVLGVDLQFSAGARNLSDCPPPTTFVGDIGNGLRAIGTSIGSKELSGAIVEGAWGVGCTAAKGAALGGQPHQSSRVVVGNMRAVEKRAMRKRLNTALNCSEAEIILRLTNGSGGVGCTLHNSGGSRDRRRRSLHNHMHEELMPGKWPVAPPRMT
ncbi:hypothetical protein K438DRAFT_1747940 [Mycena galopus ATCC 62051]|nr:hypothetical protein K438DRAFT_1747940 [Mycena galopus ATCC 62051]